LTPIFEATKASISFYQLSLNIFFHILRFLLSFKVNCIDSHNILHSISNIVTCIFDLIAITGVLKIFFEANKGYCFIFSHLGAKKGWNVHFWMVGEHNFFLDGPISQTPSSNFFIGEVDFDFIIMTLNWIIIRTKCPFWEVSIWFWVEYLWQSSFSACSFNGKLFVKILIFIIKK
jgi:hypothetical protein